MGRVLATNVITFTKDELIEDGKSYIKSLHIIVECRGMIMARLLINNGSALNVCPLITLDHLDVDCSFIRESRMMVRTFYGLKVQQKEKYNLY